MAFWDWFEGREKGFYEVIASGGDAVEGVMDELIDNLHRVNPGFYCEVGMFSDDVAELIVTAEGDVKNFVFVENLIGSAPALPHWKFTALKPAVGVHIEMNGYRFGQETLSFFSEALYCYPDEISLFFVHKEYAEKDKGTIRTGTDIYLDTLLGELDAATLIDRFDVVPAPAGQELIPVGKLPAYLAWREKEFIEKYAGRLPEGTGTGGGILEGKTSGGMPLVAMMNLDLLRWDAKPSHPWMTCIDITYPTERNGMPEKSLSDEMNAFEDGLPLAADRLKIGRVTGNGLRRIYIASREFRKISKVVAATMEAHPGIDVQYTITKDKYWLVLEHFRPRV